MGIAKELDEEAWRSEIRSTLDATKGCLVEFLLRDVYSLHGNLDKLRRAVEIAHEEIDRVGR